MDIPQKFRSKLGVYNIQIHGIKIKATLVDSNVSLETAISEFKSQIETDLPVVGVDFKLYSSCPGLLLLYAKDHCLIVQLSLFCTFPKSLGLFLSDSSICFAGFRIDEHFSKIRERASGRYCYDSGLTGKGAEIRGLAAKVLKIPLLAQCASVFELGCKTGFIEDKTSGSEPRRWGAKFFSEEEIKYAVHDAYYCHEIGKKLLSML